VRPADLALPQGIRDSQQRASMLAPAAPCRHRFAILPLPLRQPGEMSDHIVPNILGPVEKIRVVPEIVAP